MGSHHKPCRSAHIADMLDTLAQHITDAQWRAWMSTAPEFRAMLSDMLNVRARKRTAPRSRRARRYVLGQTLTGFGGKT